MKKAEDGEPGEVPSVEPSVAGDPREPYEPPRMDAEQLFETLALACAKRRGRAFNCGRIPNQS